MEGALTQAKDLAAHLGLQLVEMNDARGGRYRVLRGRDILTASDSVADIAGFLNSWMVYVR